MRTCLLLVLSICLTAAAAAPDYQLPFNGIANGAQIELPIGHANSLITDWNGDGILDIVILGGCPTMGIEQKSHIAEIE